MAKYRRTPRRVHLSMRLFATYSIVLLLCLFVAVLIFITFSSRIYIEETRETGRRDLQLVTSNLNAALGQFSNTALVITSDARVIAAAKNYPQAPQTEAARARLRALLGLNISTIINASSDIYMWDLYSLSGEPYSISGYDLTYLNRQLSPDFFTTATSSLYTQVSGCYDSVSSKSRVPVFVITKTIVDLDSRTPLALLLFVVRESRISTVFTGSTVTASRVTFSIIDENDRIVSCRDKAQLGESPVKSLSITESQYQTLKENGAFFTGHFPNSSFYAISSRIPNRCVNWRVIMIDPMVTINSYWQRVLITVLTYFLLACLILLVVTYFIARSVSQPIHQLANQIHNAATQGNMHSMSVPKGGYEIEILYNSYNELISQISVLIDNVNREQEEKSNYMFQLIQSQIKPHFLYNTLMTIKSLIDLEMTDLASECIYAMSSFYRLSLNRGNDILTIQDEIELSQQYMYIQKIRYIDRLDYVFDVPPSLYGYLIPKMTIQPLLENAIYHGIKEKPGRGVIEVIGKDLGDTMSFSIRDNGNGISPERLAKLRDYLASENGEAESQNASFGLYSVNRRIHLFYGGQYGITLDSTPGIYTVISLLLPKRMEKGGKLS